MRGAISVCRFRCQVGQCGLGEQTGESYRKADGIKLEFRAIIETCRHSSGSQFVLFLNKRTVTRGFH
jgi:hypothetical protein